MRSYKMLASMLLVSSIYVQAVASPTVYVRIKGAVQGQLTGDSTKKGTEGMLSCLAVQHEIISPRDSQTGLPTGRRMHKPMVCTFSLSKACPLLFNALTKNENLPEVTLQFYDQDPNTGSQVQSYTVRLTNARISDIVFKKLDQRDPTGLKEIDSLEVSFTYQKIQWTWNAGGITAADDWSSN